MKRSIIFLMILTISVFLSGREFETRKVSGHLKRNFSIWENKNSQSGYQYHSARDETFLGNFSDRDEIDILINGEDDLTIMEGDTIVLTLYFSEGYYTAEGTMWVDMNDNATLETEIDFEMDTQEIIDNSEDDEDPAVGIYQETMEADDGPTAIANVGVILHVEDGGGSDTAYLYVDQYTSEHSFSGYITPPQSNILVMATTDSEDWYGVMTGTDGHYQNYVPESGFFFIMSADVIGVTEDMYTDDYYPNEYIYGHLTGYDFEYQTFTTFIEGNLYDDYSNPVYDVEVYADQQGLHNWTMTDESGFYRLGVLPGWVWIGVSEDDLYGDFLLPFEESIYIEDGQTLGLNLTVYTIDSTIEGTVYLNDLPINDIEVFGQCGLGWTDTISGNDGLYSLPVTSAGDALDGYYITIMDMPPFTYLQSSHYDIMSGSTGIDLYLYSTDAGVDGFIFDTVGNPIPNAWAMANDGSNWYFGGVDDSGYYYIALPNGTYNVYGNADGFETGYYENVAIYDEVVGLNFWLEEETGIEDQDLAPAGHITGIRNIPNPFNPTTGICFELAGTEFVRIDIYNIKGQLVETLFEGELENGEHMMSWNGAGQSSGIYYYRIKTRKGSKLRKMVLLK